MAKYITIDINGPRNKTIVIARELVGSKGTRYTELARSKNESMANMLVDTLNEKDPES